MTVLFVALTISLVTSLVIVPLLRFNMTPVYGLYLLVIYIVFLLIAILVELKVINFT